jgi:hypothetical protein
MRVALLHPWPWLAGALLAVTWANGCDLNPQPLPPEVNAGTPTSDGGASTEPSSSSGSGSSSGSSSGGFTTSSSGSSGGASGGGADAGTLGNAEVDAATTEGGSAADASTDGAMADAMTDASTDASPDATGSLGSGVVCDTSHDECGAGLRCCYSGGVPLDGGPKLSTCMIDTCTPFPP